ncbi:MAG: rhomboid family intramembrane serine protease, partial [Bacteroidales bacterium]|nr:rhomboid family intramembrane serine protease [Bacteroidales bacterium]
SYELTDFVAQCATSPQFAEQIRAMSHAEILQIDGVQSLLSQLITIGASGSVFGILLAFGMMFPNAVIYLLIPPMPLKAKWLVIGYGAFELFAGVWGIQSGIAHFAHLGGMLFGFVLILFWRKHHKIEF